MKSTSPVNKKKLPAAKKTAGQPGKDNTGEPGLKPGKKILPVKNPVTAFPVVAIGASAGGLEAVTQLLQNLSPTTGMAFIYVQHLSPDHKSILTSLLSRATIMTVQEIDDMEQMKPDNVYVIPSNKEIEVMDGHIQLLPRPQNKSSNLSIDVLFSSLAETHKENVIGVVLSGSASDGTRGLKEIKQAGGITFAQDDTAKFTSMPHSAIAEGVVDFILPPAAIARQLNLISKHPLVKRTAVKPAPEDEIDNSSPGLKNILQLLHKNRNADFSHYKMNTVKRRMLRRMLIHKVKTLDQYAALLHHNSKEVDMLYEDLLINVTEFFRDTDAFLNLKKTVLPMLLKSKAAGETFRIWVAACATGEEVYSIAMLLLELQEKNTIKIPFQIFASDLSASAISEARMGEYTVQQLANVSPKRLQQFFVKSKDKYRIAKSLRDICVFAQHNILRDPPFSRMDFISCRNLLIYLDTAAQKKAITTFHYALNEGGCLMLGKSETIGSSAAFFIPLNKKYKIYSRKKNSGTHTVAAMTSSFAGNSLPPKNTPVTAPIPKKLASSGTANLTAAFDAVLLARYIPASVIINYNMEILEFRGATELFLKHAAGKASFNILKMAHAEITFELRNAIHHAIKTKLPVRKTAIEINTGKAGSAVRMVDIEVAPLVLEGEEPLLIVVFTGQPQPETENILKGGTNNAIAKDRRIKKLEEELAAARTDMVSITQDQEAANEELQSANEEIVSSNEELQSLNEELETSKEEIESTNEELTTSNQELQARIQQIEEIYTYYEAIISTIQEPMLILDKDMRIKSANKSFCKNFQVTEDECIGVSLYKLNNNQWNIPRLRELLEDIVPKNVRFHNFEMEHQFPVLGAKIMLLNAHRIIQQSKSEELIVLTIIDITDVRRLATELQLKEKTALEAQLKAEKAALKKIEDSEKRYNLMLMKSPFAFAVLKGKNMVITLANDSIKQIWGKGKKIEGKTLQEVLPELNDTVFPLLLDKVFTTGVPYYGAEIPARLLRKNKLEDVYFNFVYQPYLEADETISGVTIIAYEITPQVLVKKALAEQREAEKKAMTQIEERNRLYHKMLMESPFGFSVMTGKNMVITMANDLMKAFWGKGKDVEGKALLEVLPELGNQPFPELIQQVYSTGIPHHANEILARLQQNGEMQDKYFNIVYQPHHEADDTISGVTTIAYEVTEMVLARKKIEQSEGRFQAAVAAVQGILWTSNARGEMEGEQAGWALLTGQNPEKYQGYGWAAAVHPDDVQPTLEAWNKAVKERKTFIFEHRVRIKNGTWGFFSVRAIPLLNPDGAVNEWVGVHTNITKQRRAEDAVKESEKKYRQVIDSMPQKITNADREGNIIFFNQQWADDTGYSFEDLKDRGWEQTMHPEDLQHTKDSWIHAITTGTTFEVECRIFHKELGYRWNLSRAVPIRDENGNIKMWVGSNTDIHLQKEAQSKAEAATIAAEEAMKAKQQFLSNMSHEIRTPMNAIVGFTNVMLKTFLSDTQKQYINAIKTSGDALIVLVDDILDLAKVDAGKINFTAARFSLQELLTSVQQMFEPKMKGKSLVLQWEYDDTIPSVITGDPIRLRQVMVNLISNAIKFTDSGTITLQTKLAAETAEKLTIVFAVKDTGIGIREDALEKVFNNFEQVHTENSYGGTGLGLAIVKKLVEGQGGAITVKSEWGKGSTFSFVLDFDKPAATPQNVSHPEPEIIESVDTAPTTIKKIRVLVAEDVALNQLLIKLILEDFGFEAAIAANGKIAIKMLEANSYDIILMDLQMPEMDGFEATAFIRANMNTQIPIIALTADVTTLDVEKSRSTGMTDYLSKPIDEDLLYSKIIKYVPIQ